MRWLLKQKNILDEQADALVCSANVNLTLSGGVGANLLARYGGAMQSRLHELLQARSPRAAERGDVIPYVGPEIPYKVILHAVAIDGWYDTTPDVVGQTILKSLRMAADYGARIVALAALATGFGRLTLEQFAEGVRPLLNQSIPPIEEVVICLLLEFEIAELARQLTGVEYVPDIEGRKE
jgi:O-acetyl-ADP-ribose deacetylase